jgi:sugar lactone lactonase YvrE
LTRLAFLTCAALAALSILAGPARGAYQFETSWGSAGSGSGQFNNASFVASAPDGSVYVSDTGNNRVQKFTADGAFLFSFGQFLGPAGVAVAPNGSVYVADTGNNRVQRFDANGIFISEWGTAGTGAGQFQSPQGVGLGPDGSVYVGDSGNGRVQRFLTDGTFVAAFGSGAGGFGQIRGVAAAPDGSVYVLDAQNRRVEQFDANGVFQSSWGTQGAGDGQFQNPQGVAASDAGVYVADTAQNRVQKFSATGAFLDSFGFAGVAGIAVARTGQIYVVGNNQAARYGESGGAALPPPQTGTTANVEPVTGTVTVKPPGSTQFIPISAAQQIPIGSIVDVRRGTIDLTTTASPTTTQTARFYGGVFRLAQATGQKPVTELQLYGSNFRKACSTAARRATAAGRKKNPKVVRQLWGSGKGRFRTKGRYGSAAIRGTQWLTQDRCDGTLFRVTEGSVTVRDFPKRQVVVVRAPRSYLAAPGAAPQQPAAPGTP